MNFRGWIFIIVLGLGLQALNQSGSGQGVGWAEEKDVGAGLVPARNGDGRPQGAPLPEVETYEQLVSAIRKRMGETRKRIEKFAGRELVLEAWDIGKYMDTHVLYHQERANYGEEVIVKLAKDLESSPTEIRYKLRFARAYPIQPPVAELGWAQYRDLLSVKDSEKREDLIDKAVKGKWSRRQLQKEIRRWKQESKRAGRDEKDVGAIHELPLQAKPGKVGTYRVVLAKEGPFKGRLALDLGFSNYHRPKKIDKFKEGDMVSLEKGKLKKMPGGTDKDRYTYQAYILEVIDADTLSAVIDLGFDIVTVQTLRLRGLDAPEIESREGREAKEFLESLIVGANPRVRPLSGDGKSVGPTHGSAPTHEILIRTVRSDKYDRYLADVFVKAASSEKTSKSSQAVLDRSASSAPRDGLVYVNQALVAEGFATVVGE